MMSHSCNHPFDRSGLAALSDLQTPQWKELFALLEREQAEFLAHEKAFRSPEYRWPRDPLHTWSRVCEYPYAYYHLRKWRQSFSSPGQPHVADVGSGVTFFPFSVARLGCRVTCTDVDPVCERDLDRATGVISARPGAVAFRRCDKDRLPFADAELDAIYCISVLEHIPQFEKNIHEMARILKPGGLFLLTIDLDLRGDSEIGPAAYRRLSVALHETFDFVANDRTIHPIDMLNSVNSAPICQQTRNLRRFVAQAKRLVKKAMPGKRSVKTPYFLTVQGFALSKRT
jgi:SAM-dependent methyltransferase